MKLLQHLFDNNKLWAESVEGSHPGFFRKLSEQQTPEYLWIGCSDSRVPANEIVGLMPGDVFVHRNVGNVVVHTDLNCLSVLQYAVDILKIKHIIVCGHYGCGGVKASMEDKDHGLIDNWLRHIKDVSRFNADKLKDLDAEERFDRLCELNVVEQVRNVCQTTHVQQAWRAGEQLSVHGWIYDIRQGLLKDLDACISSNEQLLAMS